MCGRKCNLTNINNLLHFIGLRIPHHHLALIVVITCNWLDCGGRFLFFHFFTPFENLFVSGPLERDFHQLAETRMVVFAITVWSVTIVISQSKFLPFLKIWPQEILPTAVRFSIIIQPKSAGIGFGLSPTRDSTLKNTRTHVKIASTRY